MRQSFSRTSHLAPRTSPSSSLVPRPSSLIWSRYRRLALIVACLFHVVVAMWVAWTQSATDYPVYLLAARGFLDGHHVYAWGEKEFTAAAAAMRIECRAWPYLYPPLTAMIVAPLLALPYRSGLLVWCLVNGLAVVATGRVLGGLARDERTRLIVEVGTWLFCPFLTSLYAGQVNPLVTLLAAVAVTSALRRRDVLAGISLGVSLLLKPLAIGVAAYAVWRRRRGLLAATGLIVLLVMGLAALCFGPQAFDLAGGHLQPRTREHPAAQNLPSMAVRWLTADGSGGAPLRQPLLAAVVALLIFIPFAGATLLLCLPWGDRPWSAAHIALVITTVVITNPRTWYHHYAMLAVPLAILASHSSARPRLWWTALGAAYGLITLFGVGWHQLLAAGAFLDVATLGGVVVWVMCAGLCRWEVRSPS